LAQLNAFVATAEFVHAARIARAAHAAAIAAVVAAANAALAGPLGHRRAAGQ